jgi:uncharacterized membrane protein
MKKFKCTVCGYVHTGDAPPEKCPVCGADKSKFVELSPAEAAEAEAEFNARQKSQKAKTSSGNAGGPAGSSADSEGAVDRLLDLISQKHLHPISVHFPNGILPAAVLFLFLALVLDAAGLAGRAFLSIELSAFHHVAFLDLAFVVLAMPVVLFSGFVDWKKRYKGIMTKVIRTKIICGAIVFILGIALVAWRLAAPESVMGGGIGGWLYLVVNAGMLAAAGIAGNLGGRLVFGRK